MFLHMSPSLSLPVFLLHPITDVLLILRFALRYFAHYKIVHDSENQEYDVHGAKHLSQ